VPDFSQIEGLWRRVEQKNLKKGIALEGRFGKFHARFQTESGEI
jgi:hypothetical protein